jgi:hypothetical protein
MNADKTFSSICLCLSVGLSLAQSAYGQSSDLGAPGGIILRPGEERPEFQQPAAPKGPAPRTADGKPDLSGVWAAAGYTTNIAKDMKPGELPMTPWAEALYKERQANHSKDDPEGRCLPEGVPRRDPYPFKIIQTPTLVLILFEGNVHSYRQIFLDRRTHPRDLDKNWWGDSIGHWEGDTLVVDTAGLNDQTWLDQAGHPHSDHLHVTERYSRPDAGHISVQFTIDDPIAYSHPWSVTEVSRSLPNWEIHEYICNENNKDVQHLVGK